VAVGVDPHGAADEADLSGLRYGKICVLADADVDGAHIQVLLLTLFFRHFPKLIERGHVFVARPPLYRVDVPAAGKRPARRLYCLDDAELDTTLEKLADEGVREGSWSIARFKGLGEMSAEQLWETTLSPDTRRLLPVTLGDEALQQTVGTMTMLMGRGEAASRRAWIEEHGNEVEADI
jgi:topoisomerase-4 subunit B